MKKVAWALALLLLGAWDPITRKQADVAEGNERLRAGKPDEAETHYRKALGEMPGAPAVLYDLGAALARRAEALPKGEDRKKLLDQAEKLLREAGDAPDTGLRASAHYNLGNTLFAEEKWKEAIEEYKKALRLEPRREDARHNLELALARLPPPQEQPPKQQPQQGSQDDQKKPQGGESPQPSPQASNDQKDQKPQEQQGQSPPQDPQQQQGQEPRPSPQDRPQDGQAQAGQEPRPQPQQQEPQDKPPSPSAGEQAGDRDMEQKLNLLEDYSKNLQVQKAQERARERRRGQAVKDW